MSDRPAQFICYGAIGYDRVTEHHEDWHAQFIFDIMAAPSVMIACHCTADPEGLHDQRVCVCVCVLIRDQTRHPDRPTTTISASPGYSGTFIGPSAEQLLN